mgnify:FL=1
MSTRKKTKWNCLYCTQNTQYEHFFLSHSVWSKIHSSPKGMVCVQCCEKKLGRELTSKDFTSAFINSPKYGKKSLLLLERLTK